MIHRPEYVKELLRKYLEGTATPIELARWAAARHIYTDEEIMNMTAEILSEVKDTVTEAEIAEESALLGDLFAQINKYNSPTNWWLRNRSVAIIAAVILSSVFFIVLKNINEGTGGIGCIDGDPNEYIPTSVFYCQLSLGKDSLLKIDRNSKGTIAQYGNITALQNLPGIIEFKRHSESVSSKDATTLQVSTGPEQQYLVVLMDGTKIRLNASSFIRLSVLKNYQDTSRMVEIGGEAYIETVASHDKPIKIKTTNASVLASNASFNIRSLDKFTSAILVRGQFQFSNPAGKKINLICPGDKAFFVEFTHVLGIRHDTMAVARSQDTKQELMWMKTARRYNKAPLREFATDMSRWYGFTIRNLNCIPEDMRISKSICFQAPVTEVLTAFREAGLTVHEEKDVISFCDPAQNKINGEAKLFTAFNYSFK